MNRAQRRAMKFRSKQCTTAGLVRGARFQKITVKQGRGQPQQNFLPSMEILQAMSREERTSDA